VIEKPTDQGSSPQPEKPKPVVKKVRPIKAAALMKTTYLETREEVEEFLASFKQELDDALAKGERIQIR
jgi:nucleoid DNA-binding protein